MVQEKARNQQRHGQEGALDDGSCADRPPRLIGIDVTHLQPDQRNPEYKGHPIQVGILRSRFPPRFRVKYRTAEVIAPIV